MSRFFNGSILAAVLWVGGVPGSAYAEESEPEGDVVATRIIHAPAEALYASLMDLRQHEAIWPEGCTANWEHGTTHVGVGANARLTYRAAIMRRRLTATIAAGDPGRYIKVDHAGRTGFATTWTFSAAGDDTRVEVHTWVDVPPSPLEKLYLNHIQPAWQACHQGLLDNLARSSSSG